MPNYPPPQIHKIHIQNDIKTPPLPINKPINKINIKSNEPLKALNEYFNSDGDDDVDDIDFHTNIDQQLRKQCINIRKNKNIKHRYSLQVSSNNNRKHKVVVSKRKSEIISKRYVNNKINNVISDEEMIDKITGKNQYKIWNFENESE